VKQYHNHLPLELASNALSNKRNISPAVAVLSRYLSQLVAAAEHARAPASPAKVNVRVVVKHVQLLADGLQAARVGSSATGLGQDSLAVVLTQPVAEAGERIGVVGGAGGVGAAVVGVEVFVHVEDQVCCAAVEVGDFDQSSAGAVRDEGTCRGKVGTGKENLVASGAGLTDGGDSGLDGGGPCVDVEVVLWCVLACLVLFQASVSTYRLVHQTKGYLVVALVLRRNLRPKTGELGVGRASLAYDGTVPTSIVVDVNNAKRGTGVQATLDLSIVGLPVVGIECTTKVVVEKELPADC